jgi:hypothetical protein
MRSFKGAQAELAVGPRGVLAHIPAIIGPLLGLAYILIFPFVAVVSFILAGGHRVARDLTTRRHQALDNEER